MERSAERKALQNWYVKFMKASNELLDYDKFDEIVKEGLAKEKEAKKILGIHLKGEGIGKYTKLSEAVFQLGEAISEVIDCIGRIE